jgi:CubicO group peptidase (beta-lactamase class C family)
MSELDETRLHAWIDDRTATGDFSGVALVRRGGETLFEHAAGLASRAHGVPVTMASRFSVASITKLPVAIAALRLVERGVLDLHAPVVDVLPPEWRVAALTPAHTLHHLLSHTSGIANYYGDSDPTWDSFVANWDRVPPWRLRRAADMLSLIRDLPAVRPPGEAYEYSDTGFVLVGLVIEAATGRDWVEVVTDEVFTPAALVDTAADELDNDPARLAVGYLTDDGPPEGRRTNIYGLTTRAMPDGGLITTAADLARLVEALTGGRLLAPDGVAAMLRPYGPPRDDPEQYGYGCLLSVDGGRVVAFGHGGSDPGVSALVTHHLAAATTIIVLCNQDRGSWAATMELTRALGLHDPRDR